MKQKNHSVNSILPHKQDQKQASFETKVLELRLKSLETSVNELVLSDHEEDQFFNLNLSELQKQGFLTVA